MMAQPLPPLLPFDGNAIPPELKAMTRWAPWKAVWSDKRQKYDKIPAYGLSTAEPDKWFSYTTALKAFESNPDVFDGLGFVVTGANDLTGVDLDRCVRGGVVEPWAQQIIDDLNTYTEVSPSGNGLRLWVLGSAGEDWTNHTQGIEVYIGLEPRFLTVTGNVLPKTNPKLARPHPSVMAAISKQYASTKTTATVISMHMPEVLDPLCLPEVSALELPHHVKDFLLEGICRRDRSAELHASGIALYSAGLNDSEVFSLLVNNQFAMPTALDHRNQDYDRALMYLWVEQCQKAKPKATRLTISLDDFDVVPPPEVAQGGVELAPPTPDSKLRFQIEQADHFSQSTPSTWLIKGVVPMAEIGVIMGESGSGKTFFVLDLLFAIAMGGEWRGRKVAQSPVLYVCAEGAGGFRKRLRAYAEHHGLDLATIPLYVLGDVPNLMEKGDVKDLLAAVRAMPVQASLICFDTWAQVTAGANENSGEDMGRALGHCKALKKATGAMVLLVAHTGKVAERGMRGWSGIKGALDVEINVERSDQYRSATITKLKDGGSEGEEFPFALETVHLGLDGDGDTITSCVVKVSAQVARGQRKSRPKGSCQTVVMRVAESLLDMGGGVTVAQLIAASVNEIAVDPEKRDRRRDTVTRAVDELVAANLISTTNGVVNVL